MQERFAVLGASRGLGAEVARRLLGKGDLFLSSRKEALLKNLASGFEESVQIRAFDFSQSAQQDHLLKELKEFRPTRLLYFAAGGPYGDFASKSWKDHEWSFQVSFQFPARLIHFGMSVLSEVGLKQIVVTGSAIAEQKPDPGAASYSASKHGLFGLISSVRKENSKFDLRLFSPSYMETDLLPKNAWPRQQGLAQKPSLVAEGLLTWALKSDGDWHHVYK